jgi:hypothetical protein
MAVKMYARIMVCKIQNRHENLLQKEEKGHWKDRSPADKYFILKRQAKEL